MHDENDRRRRNRERNRRHTPPQTQNNICTRPLNEALFVAAKYWKQPKCLSMKD